MRIISIDPGVHCGLAVFDTIGGQATLLCSTDKHNLTNDDKYDILKFWEDRGDSTLVIEDQHKGVMGYQSYATLIRNAEGWVVCAELIGMDVVRVQPKSWQEYHKPPRGLKGPSRKKWLLNYARLLRGLQVKPNECDALLMGAYYIHEVLGIREIDHGKED